MIISIFPFRFCIFILSYLLSILVFSILYSLGHVLSYNLIHIHICKSKQRESCVGRTKEEEYRDMNEGWWPLLLITHVLKWGHIPLPFCVFTTLRFAITIEDKLVSGI